MIKPRPVCNHCFRDITRNPKTSMFTVESYFEIVNRDIHLHKDCLIMMHFTDIIDLLNLSGFDEYVAALGFTKRNIDPET